jgi:hypothetical protein
MRYVEMSRIGQRGSVSPRLHCQLHQIIRQLAYWVDWLDRGYSNLLSVSGAFINL